MCGEKMRFNKKLLAIFAIFCVIASASIVCAEDSNSYATDDIPDTYDVDGEWISTPDNENADENNYDFDIPDKDEGTNPTDNTTGNATGNATSTTTGNTTGNATGNTTNSTNATNATNATNNHGLLSTGNPIILLLVVILIIVVVYIVFKRQ